MGKIKYVCCQPAVPYYLWQVEVVINNFTKMGVPPEDINIICSIDNDVVPAKWVQMKEAYKNVNFYFYNDTRPNKVYIPAIYFHLMKKHLAAHPEFSKEVLFIHDSDIVFTKAVDFSEMAIDNKWYFSDTNSYINYDYIQSKSNDIYEKMCEIIGIDKLIPKLMNSNSGGAQYIVKNTTYEFWDKVENDSVALYNYFCKVEPLYKKENDYPIQKWTAGMWSFLWNAWYFGHETIVDKRLGFAWVTSGIADTEKYSILHNSGVTSSNDKMFYKGAYIDKMPYGEVLDINQARGSYFYWKEILETGKKSIFMDNGVKNVFTEIYEKDLWASAESKSGSGSELRSTIKIREELPLLLSKFGIKSMLDIPCGDFNWMKEVNLGDVQYIGADIVGKAIEVNRAKYGKDFRVLDLINDDLPKVDLLFVRDCLGHLSNNNVLKAIANAKRSGSKYMLATSFTKWDKNPDIADGGWKCINLMIPPFSLNPIYLINEDCQEGYPNYNDKCMILFKLN